MERDLGRGCKWTFQVGGNGPGAGGNGLCRCLGMDGWGGGGEMDRDLGVGGNGPFRAVGMDLLCGWELTLQVTGTGPDRWLGLNLGGSWGEQMLE